MLGGTGFIGRQIVAALKQKNVNVIVDTRKNTVNNIEFIQVNLQKMTQANDWQASDGQVRLNNIDVVVNAVGILRERGLGKNLETYANIHALAVKSLADACAKTGAKLLYISAIGLSAQAKSYFICSKLGL